MESSIGLISELKMIMMMMMMLVSVSATAPAFIWSPHLSSNNNNFARGGGGGGFRVKEVVNYRTLSPKDLSKSILSHSHLSNFLCLGNKPHQVLDLLLVFVGKQLHSSDISGGKNIQADPALVDFLKASFTGSNFSMAFPYVAASDEERMADALVSGLAESCENDLGVRKFSSADLHSAHGYLLSRMNEKRNGKADLVLIGNGGADSAESIAEGQIFSELIASVEQSGSEYAVLYVSDPPRPIQYKHLERFLAEGAMGNASTNYTTCDEVCQIKSSLLEGVFVGIVLLIILISGLCCMAGIDTPIRFEAPQES